jgi:hypothetical protein
MLSGLDNSLGAAPEARNPAKEPPSPEMKENQESEQVSTMLGAGVVQSWRSSPGAYTQLGIIGNQRSEGVWTMLGEGRSKAESQAAAHAGNHRTSMI